MAHIRKLFCALLAAALCLIGAALAESAENPAIESQIVEGSFVVQIPVEEGDEGWVADDMSQDPSVVTLYDADIIEGTFVARYDAVADGEVTVGIRHYDGIACDQAHTWDLRVADGAVQEVTGGSYTASPDEAEQDFFLSGEWAEEETQFTTLSIAKNEGKGWNITVCSPATHGAYILKANVYYDCELSEFVYNDGTFYDAPITDGEEEAELGVPIVTDATGNLAFVEDTDGSLLLSWYNDQSPETTVRFAWVSPDDANGATMVEPMFEALDPFNGTYAVAFDRAKMADGALNEVHIYTEDIYDIADISTLTAGNMILIGGESILVESIGEDDGFIQINGGGLEGGYDLYGKEDTNGLRVVQDDDFPTFTERFIADTLPLAENVVFEDAWDIESDPVTVTGAADVAAAIADSENEFFDQYNTVITIEGGVITHINRNYVP